MAEHKVNKAALKLIENESAKLNKYDQDFLFKDRPLNTIYDVRTTAEMMAFLESDAGKKTELEARVYGFNAKERKASAIRMDRNEFIESFKKSNSSSANFRESFDSFLRGDVFDYTSANVGQDFVPLLGGPFYKQLYFYNDWLQMHQQCFYAYNHDPIAHAAVNIIVDFTLGRGYRLDCDNKQALALWRAFEDVNDIPGMMRDFAREICIYGEHMIWWLPDNQVFINFDAQRLGEYVRRGLIPRVRLIDPSNINEIVTTPEDITKKLVYVWLAPTQYQIYTAEDKDTGKVVSGSKFIYQHIPANQIDHYKINAVSNSKRGRSDLFPALGYLKRLRDSVNYSIIAQQKAAAYCIDTTIEGDQNDIDAYMDAQNALGEFAPAGSEFVHTKAIQRQYLGAQGSTSKGGGGQSFEWALSMVCAAVGIPVSYMNTHLSGGNTRASAMVATEPVAKRFEMRQQVYERMLQGLFNRLMKVAGFSGVECEITFPEIVVQDRSAKLKDLFLAQNAGWISKKRAATIAAKELAVTEYEYEEEIQEINAEKSAGDGDAFIPASGGPLTAPGKSGGGEIGAEGKQSKVTSEQRKDLSDNDGL